MTKRKHTAETAPQSPLWNFERGSPRCDLNIYVQIKEGQPHIARKANVGLGGFCFSHFKALVPGSRVTIRFRLPDSGFVIRTRGEVLGHVDLGERVGVRGRFLDLTVDQARPLARWLYDTTLALQSRAA